ncbi:MAG: hypothetical protein JWN78_1088 [Bacteroidota bacterium]|nr:hypothetical protein [Bacteroidota bacterium]
MNKKIATCDRPFQEIEKFYDQGNGAKKLLQNFHESANNLDAFLSQDGLHFTFYETTQKGEITTIIETFDSTLHRSLYRLFVNARDCLFYSIDTNRNINENKYFLKSQLGILQSIYNNISNADKNKYGDIYIKPIVSLVVRIKERYQDSLNFRHPILKLIGKNKNTITLLGYKHSIASLKKLYKLLTDTLEEENICDCRNEREQEDQFLELITCDDPENLSPFRIPFYIGYLEIIIKVLKPLFSNLTTTTITEYDFRNNRDKSITPSDLNKAGYKVKSKKQYQEFKSKLTSKLSDFIKDLQKR